MSDAWVTAWTIKLCQEIKGLVTKRTWINQVWEGHIFCNSSERKKKKSSCKKYVLSVMDRCTHLLPVSVSTHPPPSFSLCPFSVCFLLEANCDWLIKTITAITKSNQVWAFASHRYVDRLEYKLDGVGIRPHCCQVDKSKTLKLKARSIQVPIWVARRLLNEKIIVGKKQKKKSPQVT